MSSLSIILRIPFYVMFIIVLTACGGGGSSAADNNVNCVLNTSTLGNRTL